MGDYIETLLKTDIKEAFYYTLVEPQEDNGFGAQSSYAESGLISKKTGKLKPAYKVFKHYAQKLNQ